MTNQMKQFEVLKWASLFLEKNDCEPMIAEILLQHHLALSRSQFFAHMHEELPGETVEQFQADIKKHVETGVPVQHLIGYEMFYGRKFTVNEHVLIPRPETEEIVHHTIEMARKKYPNENLIIVDVGTGSGVIAITLALELPGATIYATDISEDALVVAKENAKTHAASNITFLEGDFLKPLIEKGQHAHIVVSNPPYISFEEKDELSRTVANFDPELALFAESNGLAAYEQIVKQAKEVARENAMLNFEIGHTQGKAVQAIIKGHFPNAKVSIIQDINQKDRIVSAYIETKSLGHN